jgi:formamidopyrimidine-DNA glycosylase
MGVIYQPFHLHPMPELPEVEMARRLVDRHAVGARVVGVEVRDPRMMESDGVEEFKGRFVGNTVKGTARHGKNLFLDLGTGLIHVHLGMSGSLHFLADERDRTDHERLRLVLDRGALVLEDPRRFGRFGHARGVAEYVTERGLGPDALTITDDEFIARIGGRRRAIKPLLMDQGVLAGVGNLYADETLFQEMVHPRTIAVDLSTRKLARLRRRINEVLTTSIDLGTDFARLPDGYLLKRRGAGCHCPRCGSELETVHVGGRTAIICPACQSGQGKARG